MRKLTLLILLVLGLICSSTITKAQHGRFSIGMELAIPTGDMGDAFSLGFGIPSVRYEHPIGDNIGIGLTSGLLFFAGQTDYTEPITGFTYSTTQAAVMVPFQPFFKYYFMEQQKGFYAMAQLGITSVSTVVSDESSITEDQTDSEVDFSYAPEVGYCLDHFDFGLRYQMISSSQDVIDETTFEVTSETVTNSFIGIRVAYVFGSPD